MNEDYNPLPPQHSYNHKICVKAIIKGQPISMEKRDLILGDVVQIDPRHRFGGMLVVVTESKDYGCMGYLLSPCDFEAVRWKNKAFVFLKWNEMEYIGKLHWLPLSEKGECE